ncbi:MAG TPA: hypothetical protein VGV61_01245, partial [Thermoanaerobaculia bacterium]|nr:hypothetical protein [Thermoanaerobaculia bacterium]
MAEPVAPGEPLRDPAELAELATHPGLCASCVHLRLLRSPRSTFARCAKAEVDARFPRYPRLPVVACSGHHVAAAPAEAPAPRRLRDDDEDAPAPLLHITNGDSVLHGFRGGGVPGEYLSWADALHDGPVPATATLEELSEVRARALAAFGWGDYAGLRAAFARRDEALSRRGEHAEVVLWFEHDLFDQLQLLQLLDWFARHGTGGARLSLVQVGAFPGVEPFRGLGQLSGAQLASLLPARQPVTARQLSIAAEAWADVRAPEPTGLAARAARACPELPFLAAALRRLVEEYPSTREGLARSERQVLQAIAGGAHERRAIYLRASAAEAVPWGDASVFLRLDTLTAAQVPALERASSGSHRLTALGRRLLAGEEDWVRTSGGLDRWVGGVHLRGTAMRWRWDEGAATVVATAG